MDCSLPGSSVRGISQARVEWVAISFFLNKKATIKELLKIRGQFHLPVTRDMAINERWPTQGKAMCFLRANLGVLEINRVRDFSKNPTQEDWLWKRREEKKHTGVHPASGAARTHFSVRELSPGLEAHCLQRLNLRACREEVPFVEGQLPVGMVVASWGFLQRLGNP